MLIIRVAWALTLALALAFVLFRWPELWSLAVIGLVISVSLALGQAQRAKE